MDNLNYPQNENGRDRRILFVSIRRTTKSDSMEIDERDSQSLKQQEADDLILRNSESDSIHTDESVLL
jgi:hypothetical protein